MISQRMQEVLNDHLNAEVFSAYLYYSMAGHLDHINLPGFGNWMKVQAQEELAHVVKLFNYIIERGGRVQLTAVEGPTMEWDSPLAVFEAAYAHEEMITGRINRLVDLATEESDHATKVLLDWFVLEQVEEEATVDGIVQQLRLIVDSPHGLFMIDRELAQRVPAPPPA